VDECWAMRGQKAVLKEGAPVKAALVADKYKGQGFAASMVISSIRTSHRGRCISMRSDWL
jgi:hypothetical protein